MVKFSFVQLFIITFILTISIRDIQSLCLNVTCDYDLIFDNNVDENVLLDNIPKICREMKTNPIYHNEYQDALDETKSFAKFNDLLNEYEMKMDSKFVENNENIPEKQWEFRKELYNKVNLNLCKNVEVKDFYKCLTLKRNEMIQHLKEAISNIKI